MAGNRECRRKSKVAARIRTAHKMRHTQDRVRSSNTFQELQHRILGGTVTTLQDLDPESTHSGDDSGEDMTSTCDGRFYTRARV